MKMEGKEGPSFEQSAGGESPVLELSCDDNGELKILEELGEGSGDIPDWIFLDEFETKLLGGDVEASDLVSPKEYQQPDGESESKVSIYKTPKSRATSHIQDSVVEPDATATPKKQRVTPLPLLTWADNQEMWQNMVYKEEATAKARSHKVFDNRSTYLPRMRSILLDWIMEVCEVYHLRRNTYYLAVDYIDRYLTIKPNVPKTQLQLLGVTCLFIAAKLEEIYPPKLSEFCYICDGACTQNEILACEILLLNVLGWELNPMTPTGWLNLYMQIHHNSDVLKEDKHFFGYNHHFHFPQYSGFHFVRSSHIMDLFSMDPVYLRFNYSVIAAAAMYFTYGKQITLNASGLKWKQVKNCISYLGVIYNIVQEAVDPRLISIVPVIEDDRLECTFRYLKKNVSKLVTDECHLIQTHIIDVDYFERSVMRRVESRDIKVEKLFIKKRTDENEEPFETYSEEEASTKGCVVMYELTPPVNNKTKTKLKPQVHPMDPDYEVGKVNIFNIKQKTTVTFDDILSSFHTVDTLVFQKNPTIQFKEPDM